MYERKSERVCERGRERQGGERERDKRNLKGQKVILFHGEKQFCLA